MNPNPLHNDVIEGCRRQHRPSQETLYKAYYKAMAAICVRYTANDEDAVEVLNNGFLKVFQNIHRYDESKGALYTWIRTLVVNSCLDFIKKKRPAAVQQLTDATVVHLAPEAISRLSGKELLALVRSLPPATAAVFNLYVVEGYNHREIATLLNISEGTSKWHLSEGRKSLQHKLKTQQANL